MNRIADYFRFMRDEATTSILAALLAICFLAFILGADHDLIIGLLFIGLFTAILEARLHARRR